VALVAAAFVLGRIVALLLARLIERTARRLARPSADIVAKQLPEPIRWVVPAIAVDTALQLVPIHGPVVRALGHAVLIAIIWSVGWLGYRALKVVEGVARLRREATGVKVSEAVTRLRALRNVGAFVILLLAVASTLMTFDAVRNVGTAMLASAGVAGIVVGFAAQHTLGTVFTGIHLALAQPVRIDDFVVVEGESGYVEEITLTYVVVRLLDLRRVMVPVQYFIDKPFQNWTWKGRELVGSVDVRFDYTIPVDEIRAELERILGESKDWDGKLWKVQVTETGEWTLRVRLQMSAKDRSGAWDLECEVREKIIAWARRAHPDALPRLRSADGEPQRRTAAGLRARLSSREPRRRTPGVGRSA
jgi:small-conductance mechanosensitive channel